MANQHVDGSWKGEYVMGGVDTSFALLFLKKANVAKDLSAKMENKVKDPGKVSEQLLDLIGREVTPGVEMPKKNAPKKNQPSPEPQESPRSEGPALKSEVRNPIFETNPHKAKEENAIKSSDWFCF
jgi:hypothetical protein